MHKFACENAIKLQQLLLINKLVSNLCTSYMYDEEEHIFVFVYAIL